MRPVRSIPFLLLSATSVGQVVNTVQNGVWTDPATWSCGCVPGSIQSLVIMHDVQVMGGLTMDQPQVQVTSTGSINMSFPDQVLINTSFMLEGHVFFQGMVTIQGLIDVSGMFEMTGTLVNNGQVVMDGGSMIIEGDLLNNQSIGGDGGICVYLSTNNAGSIIGTVDICDFSPTTTIPPLLDVNSGTVAGTVTYCTNSTCSPVGLGEVVLRQEISVIQNPAADHAVVEVSGENIVRGELITLDGRVITAGMHSVGNRLLIAHPGVNGFYLLRLFSDAGSSGAVRLCFTGR
jgi:hypothetical protein